jgi:restriction system protein
MNWRDFELLVGEAFRLRGYSVEETGGGGADGGVDLRLRKGNEVFLVQCKQWRAYKVSVTVVRELLGAMAAEGATGGYVVTSGIFTIDAQKFAKGRNIRLIDGRTLAIWIEEARAGGLVKQPEAGAEQGRQAKAPQAPATQLPDPACPRCGGSMVRRIAKQGSNAGNSFWGCATFPKCRGVRGL